MKRYNVYSIRKSKTGTVWVPAGKAVENRDGSLNVYLDVLPIDGSLHLRDAEHGPPQPDESAAVAACRALVAACDAGRSGCGIIGPHHEGRNHSAECQAARAVIEAFGVAS